MSGRKNNELVQFLIGLVMLVIGGYTFLAKINVHTSWGMLRVAGINVASGLVVVPFIVGIIMLFAMPKKFISKLVAGLGFLIIIFYVIMNLRFDFYGANAFDYLLMLIGMFGGATLVLKVLLSDPDRLKEDDDYEERGVRKNSKNNKNYSGENTSSSTVSSVDAELEAMKKRYDK